jgi:uncharacterized phage protein (TIGR01671 family)
MARPKFRVWDYENKKFFAPTYKAYKGNLIWIEDLSITLSGQLIMHTINEHIHEFDFPNRFELLQYTGLKDKNGVEICEGDIISIVHPHKGRTYMGTIVYENNQFTASNFNFPHHDNPNDPFESLEYMKVIGNIYDNPELLEVAL